MKKKFQVIVADCPWSFTDSLKMSDVARGAQANYSTMSISDIKSLPVNDVCDLDGAVLCLWVPGSLLQEGLDTMKAWGFNHKQTYVWVKIKKQPLQRLEKLYQNTIGLANKLNVRPVVTIKDYLRLLHATIGTINPKVMLSFGMGRLFRQTHEICLIGTNNNKVYKGLQDKSQRSVCFAPNLKHSAKPEDLQDSLEIMFPKTRKLELFARRIRPGWTCLGNEVCNGEDIRVSLSKLT